MSKQLEEFKAKQAEQLAEFEAEAAIVALLPDGVEALVCNISKPDAITPRAWVGIKAPSYDPGRAFDPVEKLRLMEAAGWAMIDSAALVKWDNYRRAIEPCTVNDAAVFERPRYTYTDGDDVAPYWVKPCQFCKPEFCAYMRGPDGLIYHVYVDVPALPVRMWARRHEYVGGWSFENGSGRLDTPAHWPIVTPHSRAYVDTEQGVSGAAYFHLDTRKDSASSALASLLDKAE